MSLTWADIAEYVTSVHIKEDARPNAALYRLLGNKALSEISLAGPVSTSWVTPGTLTLVGAECRLPDDLLSIESVWFDGTQLHFKPILWLNEHCPSWRTDLGTPAYFTRTGSTVILSSIPTSGVLKIYGGGCLSEFSDVPGDPNPLERLPRSAQLAPAYYILSMLPAGAKLLKDENGRVLGTDNSEKERQAMYQALWQTELAKIQASVGRRKDEGLSF